MSNLWTDPDCAVWQRALAAYPSVLAAQGDARLAELDTWYHNEFAADLACREPLALTYDELERVTAWKMRRGVWRERNRQLVAGNSPAEVEQVSRQAFAAVPDSRRPVAGLSRLAGVGPATASAVLAAYRPDLYPFFDEVVAKQIPILGSVRFTAPYYAAYAEQLRAQAARLSVACTPVAWTAQAVGQALWTHAVGAG